MLRDVATDIGMHESTVSRVVNNKYVHTPQGVYELKFFFHSGISSSYGESVSSVTIKQRIKKIIEGEDPQAAAERLEDHEHPAEGRTRAGAANDREIPRGAEDSDVEPAQGHLLIAADETSPAEGAASGEPPAAALGAARRVAQGTHPRRSWS